ncbi:MAG: Hsp20/alpha crystallin family protein [Candidatus Magasanikbacteria bacterium]|nr:Hsp20/alpha crystallin family protein [Candidatus Magasanikbacteria bacterium]
MFESVIPSLMAAGSAGSAVPFLVSGASSGAPGWEETETEGQLAVDVVEDNEALVITATMAGTRAEDIELHLHNDSLTIRGRRYAPVSAPTEVHYQECFWGPFSRTVVLPQEVRKDGATAEYRHGVLTVRLLKSSPGSNIPLLVVEE